MEQPSLPGLVGIFVFSAAMIVAGLLAYAGRWRSWAFRRPVLSYAIGFGTLFVGIGAAVGGVTGILLPALGIGAQRVLMTTAFVLFLVGFLSMFWFPRFLTPEWFRRSREAECAERREERRRRTRRG